MLKLMRQPTAVPSMSVKEAAAVLDRSESWVRDHLATGLLERALGNSRKIMVTAASVQWAKSLGAPRKRSLLRLVVDNDRACRN